MDEDFICDTFENVVKAVKKEPVQQVESTKKQKLAFTDAGRAQKVNIALKKVKIPSIELTDALITMNTKVLEPPILDVLLPLIPTESEYETVNKAIEAIPENEFDEDNLDDCDLFFYLIGGLIGPALRISTMQFKQSYKTSACAVLDNIKNFFSVFEFIKGNENFRKFLTVLLKVGNYMNGVTTKGGAYGFKLNSLKKFFDLKGNDKKTTLIQYVVFTIIDDLKDAEILDIISYLKLFKDCNLKFYLIF